MDKKTALDAIVAYACCVSDFSMCGKYPWNRTDNCRDTNLRCNQRSYRYNFGGRKW